MASYFIAIAILTFIVLEHNSIYKRIYASAHPSRELDSIANGFYNHMRHANHHGQHRSNHHSHRNHHHQHHEQLLHNRPSNQQREEQQNFDDRDQEDPEPINFERLQRHFEHQIQQEQQQRSAYNHHQQRHEQATYDFSDETDESLKNDRDYSDQLPFQRQERHLHLQGQPNNLELASSIESSAEVNDIDTPVEVNNVEEEKSVTVPMGCPKCQSGSRVEHISEEELTRLRIEFVKQQILEKLRLKERPNIAAVALPKPISEGFTVQHEDDSTKNKELDDHYARTSKKYIILQRETAECQKILSQPSMCFSFKIDDAYADGFDVSTAVLWIYKNKTVKAKHQSNNNTIMQQQQIVVSEVTHPSAGSGSPYLPMLKSIAMQSIDVQDDWMKIDIEWPIKSWFGHHDLSHLIHIACQSCEIDTMEEIIPLDSRLQPFIVIDTQQNRQKISRHKRDINCASGVNECCREKLFISFDDIGWGDWIVQPRGYDAYFCRGSCSSVASVAQYSSQHSVLLKKATQLGKFQKSLELIPCCTAKQYSSLQLVFMDSNNTATQKTFPNMVVESCGCQ